MLDWLAANRDWVFSGVGVVPITLALTLLGITLRYAWKRKRPVRGGVVAPLTAKAILKAFLDAPPLQRPDVAKRYRGLRVNWAGTFCSASQRDEKGETVGVYFKPDGCLLVQATFVTSLSRYRVFGVLKEGERIRVVADIERVEEWGFYLTNAEVFFG